jgi:hypothetical protein
VDFYFRTEVGTTTAEGGSTVLAPAKEGYGSKVTALHCGGFFVRSEVGIVRKFCGSFPDADSVMDAKYEVE